MLVGATLAFGGDSESLRRNRLGREARASASARGGFWARPRRVDSQTLGGAPRFLLRFLLLLTARDRRFTSFCRMLGRVVLIRTLILASSSSSSSLSLSSGGGGVVPPRRAHHGRLPREQWQSRHPPMVPQGIHQRIDVSMRCLSVSDVNQIIMSEMSNSNNSRVNSNSHN